MLCGGTVEMAAPRYMPDTEMGGAALKDVVGYDLIAVLLGSAGRLAIITAITFRLEPATARTATSKPPGTRQWQPGLAGAFDPKGLLRSGASR